MARVTVTLNLGETLERFVGEFSSALDANAWVRFVQDHIDTDDMMMFPSFFRTIIRDTRWNARFINAVWTEYLARQNTGTLPRDTVWRRTEVQQGAVGLADTGDLMIAGDPSTGEWALQQLTFESFFLVNPVTVKPEDALLPPSHDVFVQ